MGNALLGSKERKGESGHFYFAGKRTFPFGVDSQAVESVGCAYNDAVIHFTVSAGVAFLDSKDDDELLFKRADDALYQAKAEGRNRVRLAV